MTRFIFVALAVFIAASAAVVSTPASAQVRNELMANAERMLAESGRNRCVIRDRDGGGLAEVPCDTPVDRGYNAGYPGDAYGYGYQQPAPNQRTRCIAVLGGLIYNECESEPHEERAGRTRRTRDGEDQQYCGRLIGQVPSGSPCVEYLLPAMQALERTGNAHLIPELIRSIP